MRWKKLGKIFDPSGHVLANCCVTHAQSPQAIVHEDFVRVYFSTRAQDNNNKFLSHAAFVDFEMDMTTIRGTNRHTVLQLGELGAFDEHGIFPFSPVRVGNRIYAYTTGWTRRFSVPVDTGIGLAISVDQGLTFNRLGNGPILSASLKEPFLVCDGFVREYEGQFHMWYIFGTIWRRENQNSPPDRTYKIGHAVSEDGINWRKDEARQIIPDRIGTNESQALPTVIQIGEIYHMFFCYRETFNFRSAAGRGYRIGHALSTDLTNWIRDDEYAFFPIEENAWDSEMQCYPHVFEFDRRIMLLYNGNNFGSTGFGLAELVM